MGEPIKIIDLAERLVTLYNSEVDKKIEIKITELRPGEKLHEEIISKNEILLPTENKNILLVKSKNNFETKRVDFTELLNAMDKMCHSEIKSILVKYI